jgi:hypothetical protein
MRAAALAALLVAACSAPTPKPASRDAASDAGAAAIADDEASREGAAGAENAEGDEGEPAGAGDGAAKGKPGTGVIAAKVVWPTATAAVRAVPGRSACGAPRRPAATIHTLHGVADVVVTVGGVDEAARAAPVELVVRDCAVSPRVAIAAGGAFTIASADERRHVIDVARVGDPAQLGAAIEPEPLLSAALPVVGHAVTAAIPVPSVARVGVDGAGGDPGWLVALPHRFAAVTDATGAARFVDVPAGTHRVVAWAPAAGATVRGEVTVVAGRTAEVVLTLAP